MCQIAACLVTKHNSPHMKDQPPSTMLLSLLQAVYVPSKGLTANKDNLCSVLAAVFYLTVFGMYRQRRFIGGCEEGGYKN